MNNEGFITKQQFQAVHNHFENVIGNATQLQDLQAEFKLLLDYFRSIYRESERKTHKILHLMTKMSKDSDKSKKTLRQSDEERKKLAIELSEARKNLNELLRKEHLLIQQVEELKRSIEHLKDAEGERDKVPNNRHPPPSTSFRDTAVGTEGHYSETNSKSELASQERYEDAISELSKKVNALSTELKLSYKDRDRLRNVIEGSNRRLEDLKRQLDKERERGEAVQEDISSKKSLKATIDKLVLDLYARKCEMEDLQETLEKEVERRNAVILDSKSRDAILESMQRRLVALQQSKEFASRKSDIFEEQLASDRERLLSLQRESDLLRDTAEDLRKELRTHETQHKLQMAQQKWQEASQKAEVTEQSKVIEHCKSQIASRDKKIRALTLKMSDAARQTGLLRKQLKEKVKENSVLRSELSKLKIVASGQGDSLQCIKAKLETAESSNSHLQAELKAMKYQNEVLLRDKNRLYCQHKELSAKFECQERNILMLNKQHEYHRNALKVNNSKVEKVSKKRRCTNTKY